MFSPILNENSSPNAYTLKFDYNLISNLQHQHYHYLTY